MSQDYIERGEAAARAIIDSHTGGLADLLMELAQRFANQYASIRAKYDEAADYRSTIAELHGEIRELEANLKAANEQLTDVMGPSTLIEPPAPAWDWVDRLVMDRIEEEHEEQLALLHAQADAGEQINNVDIAQEILDESARHHENEYLPHFEYSRLITDVIETSVLLEPLARVWGQGGYGQDRGGAQGEQLVSRSATDPSFMAVAASWWWPEQYDT